AVPRRGARLAVPALLLTRPFRRVVLAARVSPGSLAWWRGRVHGPPRVDTGRKSTFSPYITKEDDFRTCSANECVADHGITNTSPWAGSKSTGASHRFTNVSAPAPPVMQS